MAPTGKPAESPVEYTKDPHPNIGGWKAYSFEPYKEQKESDKPELGYGWATLIDTQDAIVLDSMPAIADRENENLSEIYRGMIMFRDMHLQAIADV